MFENKHKIIGLTSGKGGTGKSTIATAVAVGLVKKGKQVLLVDADVDCPNDHLLLRIERKLKQRVEQGIPLWNLEKCNECGLCGTVCKNSAIVSIKGKKPIFFKQQCNGCGACKLKCPKQAIGWGKKEIGKIYEGSGHGIDLLSGELKVGEPVSEFIVNALIDLIKEKKDNYDFIIIDTAAGTHCPVIVALENCDKVFAITEPTALGAHDLDLILELSQKMGVVADVVINRFDIGSVALIEPIAKKYQAKIVAKIPYSKKIFANYTKGVPIEAENIKKLIELIHA